MLVEFVDIGLGTMVVVFAVSIVRVGVNGTPAAVVAGGRFTVVGVGMISGGRITLSMTWITPFDASTSVRFTGDPPISRVPSAFAVTTIGSPGFTSEHTEVFLARGLSQDAAAPDEGELVGTVWLPVDEVVAAIRAGVIQDAKTVAGVLATLLDAPSAPDGERNQLLL